MIVRPITEDGLVGYTENGSLMAATVESNFTTFRGIDDVRGKICPICERGWQVTSEALKDQWSWRLFPEGTMVHLSCLIRHQGICERQAVTRALSGVVRFELHPSENRYWPREDPWSRKPWYTVGLRALEEAYFLIGMRKRVWHIELRPSPGELGSFTWADEARKAFVGEEVTKAFTKEKIYVHAWNDENLRRYVKMIAQAGGFAVES